MFFFLRRLKGSCFIHLVLQSGPKWPMTRYCVHCKLYGERKKRRRAKESYIRRGGWVELCPPLSDHHKASQPVQWSSSKDIKNRTFFPNGFRLSLIVIHLYLITGTGYATRVFDFISNEPLFRKCLTFFFSWHVWGYLMGFAFQLLSIRFTTKMHLCFGSASTFWTLSRHGSFQSKSA